MRRRKKDQVREDRIDNEVIVDANGEDERVMGWYYYLDDKIRFPFQAKCIAAKVISPCARERLSQCKEWLLKMPAPARCW